MLWEFMKNKTTTEAVKKIVVFILKVSLLTAKSKTSFQSFILATYLWRMNLDQNAHQISIKMLSKNWWYAIRAKVLQN